MSRTKKISDSDILDRAFEVISKEGFHSFTFEQVSRAVKLSPAALVKRFKTKKQLALLARNQRWDRNLGHVDPEKINKLNGLEGIYSFLSIIAASVNSNRLGEHAVWLGTEAGSLKSKKKVAAYFENTRLIFKRLLEEAINNKELINTIDTKSFAKVLEALVQGSIFQFAFLEERDIESHIKSHFKLILSTYLREKITKTNHF